MNKKYSVYNTTYGRLNEMNRSQSSRNASFDRAQSNYDMEEPNYGPDLSDADQDLQYAEAVEKATELVQYDAKLEGYDDMDEYARSHWGYQDKFDNNGDPYSAGAQLIDSYVDDIISGDLEL